MTSSAPHIGYTRPGNGRKAMRSPTAPAQDVMDVWSRSESKYRIRAIALLVLNILLFAGVSSFAYWLRSGEVFAPAMESYTDQLFRHARLHERVSRFAGFAAAGGDQRSGRADADPGAWAADGGTRVDPDPDFDSVPVLGMSALPCGRRSSGGDALAGDHTFAFPASSPRWSHFARGIDSYRRCSVCCRSFCIWFWRRPVRRNSSPVALSP